MHFEKTCSRFLVLDLEWKNGKIRRKLTFFADDAKNNRKKKRALTDAGPTAPNSTKPDYVKTIYHLKSSFYPSK